MTRRPLHSGHGMGEPSRVVGSDFASNILEASVKARRSGILQQDHFIDTVNVFHESKQGGYVAFIEEAVEDSPLVTAERIKTICCVCMEVAEPSSGRRFSNGMSNRIPRIGALRVRGGDRRRDEKVPVGRLRL
jgi:hypothetical protein